ncbi:unnamed protein product [Adineta steineri]|uniref:HAUS augmin-like complex subunit 3 N-terminal domain-containing protein n=1 Tax=Adineta steineri TaxID=433720 RepID=A0A819KYU6_9BILA|nr:unnamed protein product [Adineta steineri]CAF0854007.1 unnamed protein product [Adineta steineri]CAF3620800.1 unnamed protein product [Adineta steineri]CAF3954075.1 unnamed protein product [Adineta steineri]
MSNFGVAFHNLLKQIHYPGINQYEPYNFDWFVYQPGLEPFLTWIVNNLSNENFLTEDELNRYALLSNDVIENNDERQKFLDILISLDNGKMVIPWTNYQRNLTEQYSCIKAQTQALKCQLSWKQQQYKTLLMKGPKGKEKIRETRRQIEQLLQLSSPQNLLQISANTNNFQQIGINFIQMEKNYLSVLQNTWTDETTYEQNPNNDLITQLNNRTIKLVRLEVESALASVEFDTLKSQLQLCTQLKKYFDSTPIDDLKKLADRLGSKSNVHQQQRTQYETQLFNIYSSRHEHLLETIYLNILEKQFTNDNRLALKQQIILDSLNQHVHFCKLIDGLLNHRLILINQTTEQMNKIINYIKMIIENSKQTGIINNIKQQKQDFNIDLNITNLIEKIKQIENDFSKNHTTVNSFLEYINRQNEDFRPKANDLSIELDNLIEARNNEWNNLITTTIQNH